MTGGWRGIGVLILAVTLLGGGCKRRSSSRGGAGTPDTPASQATSRAKGHGATVSVQDGRGQSVTVKGLPRRVVVAGTPMYSRIVQDLGAGDRLVAVAQSGNNPPALQKLETIGRIWPLNVEKVLAHKPDLVLGTVDPYRSRLEAVGRIPVLTGGNAAGSITSLQQIYALIQKVDRLLHHNTQRSARLIGRMKARIQALRQAIPRKKPVSTAILYMPRPQDARVYVVNRKSPAHELLEMAGGTNIFAASKGLASTLEVLIQADPAVIVTDPKHVSHVLHHRALQQLRAVKAKRVVGIEASLYTSSRFVKALEALIQALHPPR